MAIIPSCRRLRLLCLCVSFLCITSLYARRGDTPFCALAQYVDESDSDMAEIELEWSRGMKSGAFISECFRCVIREGDRLRLHEANGMRISALRMLRVRKVLVPPSLFAIVSGGLNKAAASDTQRQSTDDLTPDTFR